MPAQGFTPHETLSLQSGDAVANGSKHEHDSGCYQTRRVFNNAKPLDQTHGPVDCSAHVVCGEPSDKIVECGWGWADTEEKGDFDEDENKAGEPIIGGAY